MRNSCLTLLTLAFLLSFSACASKPPKVLSGPAGLPPEQKQKLTAFKTYSWAAKEETGNLAEDADDWRILLRGAVDTEMKRRGYKKVASGQSQLELADRLTFTDGSVIKTIDFTPRNSDVKRSNGSLLIEARDPENNELIWHAASNTPFPAGPPPETASSVLAAFVRGMLRALPPLS